MKRCRVLFRYTGIWVVIGIMVEALSLWGCQREVTNEGSENQIRQTEEMVSIDDKKSEKENLLKSNWELYAKGKQFYRIGEYKKAIDVLEKIIGNYNKISTLNLDEKALLENTYFVIASCYTSLKDFSQAEAELRKIIAQAKKGRFDLDTAIKTHLQIGDIYRSQAQDYLKALEEYQYIIDNYPDSKYVEAAKENIKEINDRKVGEIYGKVYLEGKESHEGVRITVFDGFSSHNIETKRDGFFNIPFFEITKGSDVFLFVTKNGYLPKVIDLKYKDVRIEIPPISLKPIDNKKGIITGVCFSTTEGGKLEFRRSTVGESGIQIEAESEKGKISTLSNSSGIYTLILPPGEYALNSSPRVLPPQKIIVKAGKIDLVNI